MKKALTQFKRLTQNCRLAKLEYTEHKVDVPRASYKVEFVALQDTEEYKDLKSLTKLKQAIL